MSGSIFIKKTPYLYVSDICVYVKGSQQNLNSDILGNVIMADFFLWFHCIFLFYKLFLSMAMNLSLCLQWIAHYLACGGSK